MIPEVHILINDYGYDNQSYDSDIINVFENFDDAVNEMQKLYLSFITSCKEDEDTAFINYTSDINERIIIVTSDDKSFKRWYIESHLVVQHEN